MDDARLVSGRKRSSDVDQPAELSRHGDAVVADELEERRPGDELHHDVEDAFGLADVVDRDRVRMAQAGRGASLAEEASDSLVAAAIRAEHLERDLPA